MAGIGCIVGIAFVGTVLLYVIRRIKIKEGILK